MIITAGRSAWKKLDGCQARPRCAGLAWIDKTRMHVMRESRSTHRLAVARDFDPCAVGPAELDGRIRQAFAQ